MLPSLALSLQSSPSAQLAVIRPSPPEGRGDTSLMATPFLIGNKGSVWIPTSQSGRKDWYHQNIYGLLLFMNSFTEELSRAHVCGLLCSI